MATNGSRHDERRTLAISAGLVAGLATALIVSGVIWANSAPAETVTGENETASGAVQVADLTAGSCVQLDGATPVGVTVVDCDSPHDAEITNVLDYREDDIYPGGPTLSQWASETCEDSAETYIDADILDTTLVETMLVPTEGAWDLGDRTIACYVADFNGSPLQVSVKGKGNEFPRQQVVIVSRLQVGDCFVPDGDTEPYRLNSNSKVRIVDCSDLFSGMVFGRDSLEGEPGIDFPGTEELKGLTGDRCSEKFREHFSVDSSGFNYHYFRPSKQSWDANDRSIMCSILDENPIVGGFDAADYQLFFELAPGTCFNLGPEETYDSIRITDMVLPVDCNISHAGQMIGSGTLEAGPTEAIPTEGVKEIAEQRCEISYTDFMGFAPFESSYDTFPFWYPSDADWLTGDRRFACAFIGPDLPDASLQGQT